MNNKDKNSSARIKFVGNVVAARHGGMVMFNADCICVLYSGTIAAAATATADATLSHKNPIDCVLI